MAEIVLDRLTKVYQNGVTAVSDMNLTVADGEFIVLLGPSGSGKTTTLRLIAGLEDITHGTISINGTVVNDIDPQNRNLAMVFQNYALYPHMTVYKNLSFPLKFAKKNQQKLSKKQIDQKVEKIANLLKIQDLLHRKPRQLSGGQQQRTALARSLLQKPNAYLLDEPLSNLDSNLRSVMRAELKKIHTSLETTIIYVTHDQQEAMILGDRIVVMDEGLIRQIGNPLEVYKQPADRFVASFVGAGQMNFIDGFIRRQKIDINVKHDFTDNNDSLASKTIDSDGNILVFEPTANRIAIDKEKTRGVHLGLPISLFNSMSSFIDKKIILGIRAEDLLLLEQDDIKMGEEVSDKLQTEVTAIEHLGNCQDIYLRFGGECPLVARCQGQVNICNGQRVAVRFDPSRIHMFEPGEKGRNVTLNGMNSRVGS